MIPLEYQWEAMQVRDFALGRLKTCNAYEKA
jgi:hypothetical protein